MTPKISEQRWSYDPGAGLVQGPGGIVAIVSFGGGHWNAGQGYDTGRAIAALPEMMAALEGVLEANGKFGADINSLIGSMTAARAALAKARAE